MDHANDNYTYNNGYSNGNNNYGRAGTDNTTSTYASIIRIFPAKRGVK
jgi:hypothetical protein